MAITNNPFVPLIMQGVHMLTESARQERGFAREQELYKSRLTEKRQYEEEKERQKSLSDTINKKIEFFGQQSRNPSLSPETRKQFADLGMRMLQDPNIDIGQLDIQPAPGEVTYPFEPEVIKKYGLPQGAQGSLGQLIDLAKTYQDDLRMEAERRAGGIKNKELSEVEKKINVVEEELKGITDKYGDVIKGNESRYNNLKKQHEYLRNRRAEILGIDLGKVTSADMKKEEVRNQVRQLIREGKGIGNSEKVLKLKRMDAEEYLKQNGLPVTDANIDFYITKQFGE